MLVPGVNYLASRIVSLKMFTTTFGIYKSRDSSIPWVASNQHHEEGNFPHSSHALLLQREYFGRTECFHHKAPHSVLKILLLQLAVGLQK